jgi:predicted transcriptional regulator
MHNQHQDKVKELSDEIASLNAQLKTAELTSEQLAEQLKLEHLRYIELEKTIPSTELPEGTVYQVQMGFYQYLDLVSFNDKLKTVRAEEIDGKKRYVIGHFDNLLDAVQFSNDIKRIGVSDAFVTEYIDGKRNMNFDAYKGLGE